MMASQNQVIGLAVPKFAVPSHADVLSILVYITWAII
jgi:hypothetical protein